MGALWAILSAFALVLVWAWFVHEARKGNKVIPPAALINLALRRYIEKMKPPPDFIGVLNNEVIVADFKTYSRAAVRAMNEFSKSMGEMQRVFAKHGPLIAQFTREAEHDENCWIACPHETPPDAT